MKLYPIGTGATGAAEEVHMRREVVCLVLLALATSVLAQQEQGITVKNSEVNNGVVIVTAQQGQSFLDLRCNKDLAYCKIPEPGNYLMVRVRNNWWLYQ
jgi:hypothetical protein